MKLEAAQPLRSNPAQKQAPKQATYRQLLRWSLLVIGGAPRLFLAGLALSVVSLVLGQYSIRLLSRIITALASANPSQSGALGLTAWYIGVTVLVIALQIAARQVTIRADSAMLGSLQLRLHDGLLRMPPSYHDQHDIGETTTIVMQDAAGCQPMLRDLVSFPVTQGIGLVSALVFLVQSLNEIGDVPIGVQTVLAVVLLVLPFAGWWFSSRVRHAYDAVRNTQARVATEFANSATLPLEVRLMGAEQQRSYAFATRLHELMRLRVQAQTRAETSNQFQTTVPVLLQAGFLAFAAVAAVRSGAAAAGTILSVYYFVPKVIEPLDQMIRFLGGIQMILMQTSRLGNLLDATPPVSLQAAATAASQVTTSPSVRFEAVTFSYASATVPVLRAVSHVFPAGRVTAVVGRSGTGKSSILALIDGMRSPQAGQIKVGDVPVTSPPSPTLLDQLAVVSQFPLFITDTIRANVHLAKRDASDAEIEEALRRIGLWPALVRLGGEAPLDYVLPRAAGQGLSGGERRQLAVGRMMLRQPKLLLLDEPTTGVDAMSVGQLMDGIRRACVGVTVIMVEHNLDVVQSFADEVCCLQDGVFVDIGTPEALAARPSLFSQLLAARSRLGDTGGMDIESVPMPVLSRSNGMAKAPDLIKGSGVAKGMGVVMGAVDGMARKVDQS